MVILPGVALAASRGISQAQTTTDSAPATGVSHKIVSRYSNPKYAYKVPKTEAKQKKYISFLTTLLSLTTSQQDQAASIFANASTAVAQLKQSTKTARQTLGGSVASNDRVRIRQTSVSIGTLAAQRHSIGAAANADFLQTLTPDQQAKLTQFRS
jgi:Spy/CpxP family protein refolding chaperone